MGCPIPWLSILQLGHSHTLEPEAGGQPGLHNKTLSQKEINIQTTADHNFIWWFDLSHSPVSLISKQATFALFHWYWCVTEDFYQDLLRQCICLTLTSYTGKWLNFLLMFKVHFRAHTKHMKTFLKSLELHPLILRNANQLEPKLT